MKVYLVMWEQRLDGGYPLEYCTELEKIFSTKELAIDYIKKIDANDYVNEWKLDELEDTWTNELERKIEVSHEYNKFYVEEHEVIRE